MSLLPLLFRDVARPLRMMEHQMRLGEELFPFLVYQAIPRGRNPLEAGDGKESVIQDRDKFQVKLDVENFSPEEITIKAIDGNAIVVEAKHEKSDENGHICRQFYRKFVIPKGHDMKKVESVLSADGILTITAPNKVEQLEEQNSSFLKGHEVKKVELVLSADGILTITAPNKVEQAEKRAIPITHIDTSEGKS
ncbi:hypothetical protein PPYR_14001 [Photinus pyralis]|uniref:SHSP domain-containing protein n=1 Tax=Photinus pyralis TaxID=7054 RepID=A0A5N4A3Z1_PHOPY|nr:hypothetical protein PPYR_14001 [Photinus pyralis]